MGQRSNIDDFGYFDTCSMNCADGRFAAVAGTFDISLHFTQAKVVGVGSVLFGTAEAHLAG